MGTTTNVSFISNTGETHKDFLLDHLENADRAIIAVGFLKRSGVRIIKNHLKEFCADNTKSCTFYIGVGFGETDPDALQDLFNVIKAKKNHDLVICTPDAGIFHPKIYVFIAGGMVTIVTGSSNLTQNGWVVNDEVSTIIETTTNSPEHLRLSQYFAQLHKNYHSNNIQALIQLYKKEKEEYDNKFGKAPLFKFKRKRTTVAGIDMPRLKSYYLLYKQDAAWFVPIRRREEQYAQAKSNLDTLASNKDLTKKQFHELFGPLVGHKLYKPKLWHSGSIHRTTYKTLDYPEAFRELIRLVKRNTTNSVSSAFDNVISRLKYLRVNKEIDGVGKNIVTEIFLSYMPDRFANLNENPLAVLKLVGKQLPTIPAFTGGDYGAYVDLLSKIKDELQMATFLEIDSFFNYVYWNLTEE